MSDEEGSALFVVVVTVLGRVNHLDHFAAGVGAAISAGAMRDLRLLALRAGRQRYLFERKMRGAAALM